MRFSGSPKGCCPNPVAKAVVSLPRITAVKINDPTGIALQRLQINLDAKIADAGWHRDRLHQRDVPSLPHGTGKGRFKRKDCQIY